MAEYPRHTFDTTNRICRTYKRPREERKYTQEDFNCCLSVHVDNYTIIVPTKCTSLLKAQGIKICTLCLYS
jgi:hypothetical protein